MKKLILIPALLITACSSTPQMSPVIPLANDIFVTTSKSYDPDEALKVALYTADKTCRTWSKRYVVNEIKKSYKGKLQEGTKDALNAISTLSILTGNGGVSFSSKDDYQVRLTFACE